MNKFAGYNSIANQSINAIFLSNKFAVLTGYENILIEWSVDLDTTNEPEEEYPQKLCYFINELLLFPCNNTRTRKSIRLLSTTL